MSGSKVLIYGSGNLAIQLAHMLERYSEHEVVGFLDDYKVKGTKAGSKFVLGDFSSADSIKFDFFMNGIGYNDMIARKEVYQRACNQGYHALTFIHPTSFVDISARILPGCVIYPNCVVDQRVVLYKNTLLNCGAVISHDSKIGAGSFLSPGVTVAGACSIGASCFVGVGATITDNVSIVDNCTIGAGSLVIKNITESGKYFGVPALKR